jgi:transcription termination/antitermination protein NusG
MLQLRWYAAYTYSRHEKKVLDQLALRRIESFLPSYRAIHKWRNGCKVEVQSPLFPGYVFVKIRSVDQMQVLQIPSVVTLVGFRGHPVPLPTQDIEALRAALSTLQAEPYPFLRAGERVRVTSGCLAGIEGILVRKAGGFRFVLNVDLLTQAASVEVSAADVEKLSLNSNAKPTVAA